MLQTIQKLGPLLDLFTVERPEWGASEVGVALGVPRSSAHSMLSSLTEIGLLQCHGRGRYRIGWRVVELGETLRAATDVRAHAAPVLRALHERYGETTHLAVLSNGKALYIDKIVGTHMLNVVGARVGSRLDLHCTGVGKVLIAHREPEEIRALLGSEPLRRYTAATITDRELLMQELRMVRAAGCGFDNGEVTPEVHCVAAPVKDDLGVVAAAVSISVPASRFLPRKAELKRAVIAAGAEITRSIREAANGRVPAAAG